MSWWESAPLADENKGDWWSSAPLADDAKQELPKGVTPSDAGAGRGRINPPTARQQRIDEMDEENDPSNPNYLPITRNAQQAIQTDARGLMDAKRTKTPGRVLDADIPSLSPVSVAQDVAAGALQIIPTAAKGVGDLARLATGNQFGKGLSDYAERSIKAAQDIVGSDRGAAQRKRFEQDFADPALNPADLIVGNPGALSDMALPQLGSMALPIGAAAGASKLAKAGNAARLAAAIDPATVAARAATASGAAVTGTIAAQNAADTYTSLIEKGRSQEEAYRGAVISAGVSVLASKLTGGGAEGAIARSINGKGVARGTAEAGKAAINEGAQEAGEQAGSSLGELSGSGEEFNPNQFGKELAVAATLGGVIGGGVNVAQQIPSAMRAAPRVEDQPTVPAAPAQTVPDIMRVAADIAPTATNTGAADRVAAILNLEQIQGTPDAASPLPNAPAGQAADGVPAGLATAGGTGSIDTGTGVSDGAGQGGLELPLGAGQSGGEFSGDPVSLAEPRATELDQRQAPQAALSQEPAPMVEDAAARQDEPAATVEPARVTRLGVNNVDIAEGGKPFKTRLGAKKAKKSQPMMRVLKAPGGKGYILTDKTPAQLASEAERARRMALPSVGKKGKLMAAHEFIASEGGLNSDADAEIGFGRNPKIGNRTLYAKKGSGKGLTLSQAAEKLWQNGYSNEELSESEVAAMMKRSFDRPTYTAEGFDRIAQAETETRFEDYMAAQVETQNSEFDPFPLPEGYTSDIRDESGYDDATQQQTRELEALIDQAEAEGIDTDSIRERFAQQENLTDEEYRAAVRAEVANQRTVRANSANPDRREDSQQGRQDAFERVSPDRGQPDRAESAQGNEPEGLTSPTREDILDQQDRAENAQALDDRAQIGLEAAGQTLTRQTAPEQRKDTTADIFGGPTVEDAEREREAGRKAKAEAKKGEDSGPGLFGQPPAEPAQQSEETNLLALSRNQEKPGDVMLGNGRFASFDDTVRVAKARIAAGEFKPTPSQLTFHMDLSQRDVDRVAEALNAPVAPPEPAPRPPATVVELRKRVAVLKKLKGCLA